MEVLIRSSNEICNKLQEQEKPLNSWKIYCRFPLDPHRIIEAPIFSQVVQLLNLELNCQKNKKKNNLKINQFFNLHCAVSIRTKITFFKIFSKQNTKEISLSLCTSLFKVAQKTREMQNRLNFIPIINFISIVYIIINSIRLCFFLRMVTIYIYYLL